MMRWFVTGGLIGIGGVLARARVGDPFAAGADTAERLGQITGAALMPLLLGFVVAWLWGRLRPGPAGTLHRRTNGIALVLTVLSAAGQFAVRTGA